jgi:hypothetical protein
MYIVPNIRRPEIAVPVYSFAQNSREVQSKSSIPTLFSWFSQSYLGPSAMWQEPVILVFVSQHVSYSQILR